MTEIACASVDWYKEANISSVTSLGEAMPCKEKEDAIIKPDLAAKRLKLRGLTHAKYPIQAVLHCLMETQANEYICDFACIIHRVVEWADVLVLVDAHDYGPRTSVHRRISDLGTSSRQFSSVLNALHHPGPIVGVAALSEPAGFTPGDGDQRVEVCGEPDNRGRSEPNVEVIAAPTSSHCRSGGAY
ncbi:MAG: hypothetical protein R3E96_01955 [Planctomycetota bacterium]